jgi:hypothetical protein
MDDRDTALECLKLLNPATLSYEEWLNVGMALQHAGCSVNDWDVWSSSDSKRFHPGGCQAKWKSFRGGGGAPVTVATLVKLSGYKGDGPDEEFEPVEGLGAALDWDSVIGGKKDKRAVKLEWLQDAELPPEPEVWDGAADFRRYLEALFRPGEHVGFVTESYQSEDGHHLPKKGHCSKTSAQLIEEIDRYKGDLGAVIGDWPKDCGAWIRVNPLDGQGVRDENVTAFRHVLVESDSLPVERQFALYKELEIPVAALVHSGGKSLHAVVKVEAKDMAEYRQRVDYLYGVCKKSGMELDRQNRNPSRLSRLPGATRGGKRQWLLGVNLGKDGWDAWREHIESVTDDLPDFESLAESIDNLPPLADELIAGLLRCGHKMLLQGPSKAGKSFLQIELAIAIAEGLPWLGMACKQGRALYVNLELDGRSCKRRFADVYKAMGVEPKHAADIDIWNLRGKGMPLDALAPKLVRRALKRRYAAIIIDPIYKVMVGDENNAGDMGKFCNLFDMVCDQLQAATVYCHHHSKGQQGQKRAIDRSSGSGVFARDPDAIIDIVELELDEQRRKTFYEREACDDIAEELRFLFPEWREHVAVDDALVLEKLLGGVGKAAPFDVASRCLELADEHKQRFERVTAWRLEATLREFPPPAPVRFFFRYPLHVLDVDGLLKDVMAEGEANKPAVKKELWRKKKLVEDREQKDVIMQALAEGGGETPVTTLAEILCVCPKTVRNRVNKMPGFTIKENIVCAPSKGAPYKED